MDSNPKGIVETIKGRNHHVEFRPKICKLVNLGTKDAEKAAEIVAKSFYKTLRKSGFSAD